MCLFSVNSIIQLRNINYKVNRMSLVFVLRLSFQPNLCLSFLISFIDSVLCYCVLLYRLIELYLFASQAQMIRCMLSRIPAERPEASEITEASLFQELEVPCRIRPRTRTYSASSAGRPTRQTSSSNSN